MIHITTKTKRSLGERIRGTFVKKGDILFPYDDAKQAVEVAGFKGAQGDPARRVLLKGRRDGAKMSRRADTLSRNFTR